VSAAVADEASCVIDVAGVENTDVKETNEPVPAVHAAADTPNLKAVAVRPLPQTV